MNLSNQRFGTDTTYQHVKDAIASGGYRGYDSNTGLVNPSWGDQGASDTYAAISRAQWEDYKARFMPKIQELQNIVTDTSAQEKQIQRNVADNNAAMNSVVGQTNRNLQRYGVTETVGQKAARNDQAALNNAASRVDTMNRTRDTITSRNLNILAGSGQFNSDQRQQVKQQ